MKVLFLPEVIQQFIDLTEILYDKGYVSFPDEAFMYSESLFHEIQSSIALKAHKKAPEYFNRFGSNMYYSSFRKNRHTTWYVFFNIYHVAGEPVYLVRYMSNNHIIAHHLDAN